MMMRYVFVGLLVSAGVVGGCSQPSLPGGSVEDAGRDGAAASASASASADAPTPSAVPAAPPAPAQTASAGAPCAPPSAEEVNAACKAARGTHRFSWQDARSLQGRSWPSQTACEEHKKFFPTSKDAASCRRLPDTANIWCFHQYGGVEKGEVACFESEFTYFAQLDRVTPGTTRTACDPVPPKH